MRIITLIAIAGLTSCTVPQTSSPVAGAAPQTGLAVTAAAPQSVCKYVVSAQRGAKPYELCLTESQWSQRNALASKDTNRIVCRYQEVPGDRFRSKKICQSAFEWAEHRRLEREAVEAVQRGVCVPGAGC